MEHRDKYLLVTRSAFTDTHSSSPVSIGLHTHFPSTNSQIFIRSIMAIGQFSGGPRIDRPSLCRPSTSHMSLVSVHVSPQNKAHTDTV